jgi:heterodisulfide reductase subunit A-like polyferredoxin
LNLDKKHVTIIGAGVAGLTAADSLSEWGIHVLLLEKTPFPGGHAIQLDLQSNGFTCVKCGACIAEDKLNRAVRHPKYPDSDGHPVGKDFRSSALSAALPIPLHRL